MQNIVLRQNHNMVTDYSKHEKILNECLSVQLMPTISEEVLSKIKIIVKNSENAKGMLSVLITSLLEKSVNPNQDVRYHRIGWSDTKWMNVKGYGGRILDTNVTVPFMKKQEFPAMVESGWLTRGYEQLHPYTLDYPANLKPKTGKIAFLKILEHVEVNKIPSKNILIILLNLLKQKRDAQSTIMLSKPTGKHISQIIDMLKTHFNSQYTVDGAARLPVLAIYAAYQQMMNEVGRYKNAKLDELKAHNSPDSKSGDVGDIQITDQDGILEAVEIKHDIMINSNLVENAFKKFRGRQVSRYYLLTTHEDIAEYEKIQTIVISVKNSHGCQLIVNGIMSTLKYYLRLLRNTDSFIKSYVELVEKDKSIKYEHKIRWNEIVSKVS